MPETPNLVEIPEGAVVVYPKELVQAKFGHRHPGSTRKEMSRHDVPAVTGYPVEAVEHALEEMDPKMAGWSRTPKGRPVREELPARPFPKTRRK